jgi:hypothetical protein
MDALDPAEAVVPICFFLLFGFLSSRLPYFPPSLFVLLCGVRIWAWLMGWDGME